MGKSNEEIMETVTTSKENSFLHKLKAGCKVEVPMGLVQDNDPRIATGIIKQVSKHSVTIYLDKGYNISISAHECHQLHIIEPIKENIITHEQRIKGIKKAIKEYKNANM